MRTWSLALYGLSLGLLLCGSAAADQYGLETGRPEIQSIGALAFGPEGILFAGDSKGGVVYAFQTGDKTGDPGSTAYDVPHLNKQLAGLYEVNAQQLAINDVIVNPQTGNLFVSVTADGKPGLAKVAGNKVSKVSLEEISFSKAPLADAPEDRVVGEGRRARNYRESAITDLAYVDGHLLVSGMSNAASPSAVRTIEFPFSAIKQGTSIEIYHAAHGAVEDFAMVRTFVPLVIDGEPHVLAGFQCTPLVRFPLADLNKPGTKVRGTTVAELGNQNRPLDMIAYEKDGKVYILSANTARGVQKISTENIEKHAGLNSPVRGGGVAGQPFEEITAWKDVVQLDKLNDTTAVVLIQPENGDAQLKSLPLP